MAVDFDRGVIIRDHPGIGISVYMYSDNPGVYFDAYGNELSIAVAEQAGYDVDILQKKKALIERRRLAIAAIDAEAEAEPESVKVISENGPFKALDIGSGRAVIEDADGNRITPSPITVQQAKKLILTLVDKTTTPAE